MVKSQIPRIDFQVIVSDTDIGEIGIKNVFPMALTSHPAAILTCVVPPKIPIRAGPAGADIVPSRKSTVAQTFIKFTYIRKMICAIHNLIGLCLTCCYVLSTSGPIIALGSDSCAKFSPIQTVVTEIVIDSQVLGVKISSSLETIVSNKSGQSVMGALMIDQFEYILFKNIPVR